VLFAVLLVGCSGGREAVAPSPEPTAAAEPSDFEELSGAEIPESAESVEVFSVGGSGSLRKYVATFSLPDEEEAKAFCASGKIGYYRVLSAGDVVEEQRERHFIGETELVDPVRCTSVKQGESIDRSVVFSFPEGERVSVWAVTQEVGW
jgi:hypothetical protein